MLNGLSNCSNYNVNNEKAGSIGTQMYNDVPKLSYQLSNTNRNSINTSENANASVNLLDTYTTHITRITNGTTPKNVHANANGNASVNYNVDNINTSFNCLDKNIQINTDEPATSISSVTNCDTNQ